MAEVSGKFRFQAVVSSDYPAVGDFVLIAKGRREKEISKLIRKMPIRV